VYLCNPSAPADQQHIEMYISADPSAAPALSEAHAWVHLHLGPPQAYAIGATGTAPGVGSYSVVGKFEKNGVLSYAVVVFGYNGVVYAVSVRAVGNAKLRTLLTRR
jgi:hypothetical protein